MSTISRIPCAHPFIAFVAPIALALACAVVSVGGCGGNRPRPTHTEPLPEDTYRAYLRGQMATRTGNHAEAILHFRTAARTAPDQAPIALALIAALRRDSRNEQAREHAERAAHRWPREADVWLVCGDIYRSDRRPGDRKRAIAAYRRAVRLEPQLEAARLGLAQAYFDVGRRDDGLRTFRELLVDRPDSSDGHRAYAAALLDSGEYAQAAFHARSLIALDFRSVDGYRLLARALRFGGRDAESLDVLRQGFRGSRDSALGLQLVAQLAEAGERDAATEVLIKLERAAVHESTLLMVGERYLTLGNWRAAARVSEQVRSGGDLDGYGVLLWGQAQALGRRASGDIDAVVAGLLAMPKQRPAYVACRALAVRLLARAGRLQRARQVLDQLMPEEPLHWIPATARAAYLERAGRPQAARRLLDKALAQYPREPRLVRALAELHLRQGRPAQAATTMQRILAADSDDPKALGFIGATLIERGVDLPRAERLLMRAILLAPGDARLLGHLGWLRFKQNRPDDARRMLERAATIFPYDAEVLWHLGEVALARSDRRRGLDLLQQARELAPGPHLLARIEARLQALSRP